MASQQNVQELLRLLTSGRNKITMLAAMGRVKELQNAGLHSIADIASKPLTTLQAAIPHAKVAKSLHTACKTAVKSSGSSTTSSTSTSIKRSASDVASPANKKHKSVFSLPDEPLSGKTLEASLELPKSCRDEEELARTVLITNRAPLVLVFALVLLKYTMPEQPLSGRLSLAQAVCSANSRSKAVSLGLEKGSAEGEGWGAGQPKVKILSREVSVLKRSGYTWKEEGEGEIKVADVDGSGKNDAADEVATQSSAATLKNEEDKPVEGWTVSVPITSKSSTFVARSIAVSSLAESKTALQTLLVQNPDLRDASHNITAVRLRGSYGLIEDSNDDGETGGGRHILGVLRDHNAIDVLLVVTRWYGGIMLGTDRWRIMTQVSRDALSQRLRVVGTVGDEALWGLDLEGMKSSNAVPVSSTLPVHRPENARAYILKAFASVEDKAEDNEEQDGVETKRKAKKRATAAEVQREKEENLGKLMGALELLFESWVERLSRDDLDRRAWSWYVAVRPDVEAGVSGWGGKGELKLDEILKLRRKD